MTFLLPLARSTIDLELQGRDVSLRAPVMADYTAWAELRALSRAQLEPYEPSWTRDELSRSAFRYRLKHYNREIAQDLGYPFFVFNLAGDMLFGAITVSNVRRGIAQTASVGYWMGTPYAGQGHMTRALRLLCPFAFRTLQLHRLEAGCVPENAASVRVLEKSGFVHEGRARDYLRINGTWRDHLLFARLGGDQQPAGER